MYFKKSLPYSSSSPGRSSPSYLLYSEHMTGAQWPQDAAYEMTLSRAFAWQTIPLKRAPLRRTHIVEQCKCSSWELLSNNNVHKETSGATD